MNSKTATNHPPAQAGQAALITIVIITSLAFIIIFNLSSLTLINQKIIRDAVTSRQSYYTAEAGIEDTLLRVINSDFSNQSPNSISLAGSTASITTTQNGQDLTVVSEGNARDLIRKVAVNLVTTTSGASFFFGVQVDDGGLSMKNNSQITGNIYSNGNITGLNDATITGDAWAAGTSTISGFTIGNDAYANTILESDIGRDAYYQTIDEDSTVGGIKYPGTPDPERIDMPIPSSQIASWQSDAEAGGELSSYTLEDSDTDTLGPIKINGDMHLANNSILTITGTIWVTGNVLIENKSAIQLSPGYGDLSGILIADGAIDIKNQSVICGSEGYNDSSKACNPPADSYLFILSTSTALDESNPAIHVQNNADMQVVLYASNGLVFIENNAQFHEITGYALSIQNNAEIIYESGLANIEFTSGPSGGWEFIDWTEVD